MDRKQILAAGLSTLKEMGLVDYKKPDPQNHVIGTLRIWEMATADLSDLDLKSGFDGLIVNCTSDFNKRVLPGDLRKFINKNTSLNHGEMFKEIMAHAHDSTSASVRPGTQIMEKYQFSPLVSEAIKQMGGIDSFKHLLIENESTFRAQFRDVVNALNEKDQNKHFVQPVLDARAALAESVKPQPKAIEAPKAETESPGPDPRVLDAFAALKANFHAKGIAKQTTQVQAMRSAAEAMKSALEMMP